jgi:imidazolonepropionase-like amidohydrolase
MKKVFKWIGFVVASLVVLGIIGYLALQIYDPGLAWVKPGIPQRRIPAGVETPIVFENVNVIPMDSDRTLEGQSVVIEAGRISETGQSGEVNVPADAYIIDGSGKYLIPGLSDMIVHTDGSENDLLVYLANGVTTIRIMGEDPPDVLKWRDQINAGKRVGPTMWVWWPQIESNDFDDEAAMERSTRGGKSYVHSPEDAEMLVAEAAAMGVDGIKAHVVVSSEIYRVVVDSAAQHGLPYDGHAPVDHNIHSSYRICDEQDCWNDFMNMGVPALTHVEELVKLAAWTDGVPHTASDETIRQMAQDVADNNMAVTTSVFLMRTIMDQASDLEGSLASMPEIKYLHPVVFDFRWVSGPNSYVDLGGQSWYPNYLASIERMLLALNDSGVLLMSGTDAPVPLAVPGFSLHDELETMVDVGLSSYDVLKTSTYNPALYLGKLDEVGTVEVGKRADLVLLEANPLEDITSTREIAGVMIRGRYFDRADLDTILELVAKDYEKASTNQTIIEIVFPIIVVLLLVMVIWMVVRKIRQRKANRVSS